MIGQTLGHYRILDKLGAGGMGEVYLAEDTELDRKVALKVLPHEMACSRERLHRFRREAKILASLNHPSIVTIYSVDNVDAIQFLTMEVLEGKTLADSIPKHGVDLEEFFRIAIPLVDALSAAHEKKVIHRDLKPSNVFVTRSGAVKVLDFGLATVRPSELVPVDTEASTDLWTGEGRVMGTVPHMSPEQVQGKSVDHRSDIFSLGIVLYQLATGDRPFKGTTSADVWSSILRDTPQPVDDLKRELPHHLGRIVSSCLEKDPDRRWQSAKDIANQLTTLKQELSARDREPRSGVARSRRAPAKAGWWVAATALVALGLLIGFVITRFMAQSETATSMHIPMAPPPGLKPSLGHGPSVAISPDGRNLAYVMERGTTTMLYVKGLEEFEARPMAGTEGARTPSFSPRGRWIAFFDEDDRKLKKVSLSGGEPVVITDADSQWGIAWAQDDTILFSSRYSGLVRVSADGGTRESVTTAEARQHLWPTLLPGGEVALFTILPARGSFDDANIAAIPVAGGTPTIVLESAYYPHYAGTGHLIYVQGDSVRAAPFDLHSLEVTGPAATVLEGVWTSSWTGYADFAFSDGGTLVYVSGGPDPTRATLVSVDRDGTASPLADVRRPYRVPRISPDGRQVAVTIADAQVDIWTFDLLRKSFYRLTDSTSWDAYPLWQPGAEWLAFSSMREGLAAIYRKDLRSEEVEKLVAAGDPSYPSSWSPNGKLLAYSHDNPETGRDIWVYSLETRSREIFLRTQYNESAAEFSPDGRFLAYHSNEGGQQLEVYVRPYPEVNPRRRISTDGGRTPRWGAGGKELYYLVGGKLMVVDIETEPELVAGSPRELFEGPYGNGYDAAPDGQSFVMLREMVEGDPPLRINFIANWFDELKRRVPSRQ